MIERLFDKTFTVQRNQWSKDEDNNDFSELVEVGELRGHMQQASAEMVERFALNFQTAFSVWCAIDADVKKGDTLLLDDQTFTVKAIKTNDYGRNPHLQLMIEGGERELQEGS